MVRKNLLRGFKKPKGITFEHSEVEANYGRFVAYPFERGYGVTIGNTLRRILLSSIQGYAISAVKITTYKDDGSPHIIASEYEPIPEVVEDTPDFINNLKQVQVRLAGDLEEKTHRRGVQGRRQADGARPRGGQRRGDRQRGLPHRHADGEGEHRVRDPDQPGPRLRARRSATRSTSR